MKKIWGIIYFFVKEFFWGTINALVMISTGVAIASFLIYRYQMPKIENISQFNNFQTSVIYDRTGKNVLYEIHGEENRKTLSHGEIPNVVRVATIATEDKYFYNHFGIDLGAIIRALKINLERKGIFQGGSTITQQLARNVFLTREKTMARKIKEAILAVKIENNLTKDQILDLYLNEVPYGSNAYGIEKAAEIFFRKKARELTLDEAVFLAALPKAPTYYSPYGNHREELKKRQEKIYKKLADLKIISQDEIEKARFENTFAKLSPFQESIVAPHFVFYVIEDLERKYGKDFLISGGVQIYTTLDMNIQKIGEEVVSRGAEINKSKGAENAALVAISPKSGEILAMVGSRNYFDREIDGQVNVVTSLRQPGSSFKPIVYSTAFEKGLEPETLISDSPTNFGPDGSGGDYIPRNYDGKFHGTLPIRKTLAMSLNIPAVKTMEAVGIDSVIDMAHRLGISTLNERKRYGLSLAIGGGEVRPIDLTSAFSVFAADGKRSAPRAVLKIKEKEGHEIAIKSESEQIIDPQVARKINSVLSDNDARASIFGPRSPLFFPDRKVAAKTGTTQEFRDAWTVGYTPEIATGVWVGNNDNHSMKSGSDGIFVAAPIWRAFMDQVLPGFPPEDFVGYEMKINRINLAENEKTENKKKEEKKDSKKRKKG